MNTDLREQIWGIAFRVRKWTEDKDELLSSPTKNLSGWCGIAAAELSRKLSLAGIENKIGLYENERGYFCHAFVLVEDHVVDVTATQFSEINRKQKVVILHQKESEQYEFYTIHQSFSAPDEFRDYQIKKHWPSDQIAYPEVKIRVKTGRKIIKDKS
jgi:hypothetical protein